MGGQLQARQIDPGQGHGCPYGIAQKRRVGGAEHCLAPRCRGQFKHGLRGADDLPRLGHAFGDNAVIGGAQYGIGQGALRLRQRRAGLGQPPGGRGQRLIGRIQRRLRADPARQHGGCAVLRLPGLFPGGRGRDFGGLRDMQCLFLLQRIGLCQGLALRDPVADAHQDLDDPAAKAKADLDAVLGIDRAGQRDIEGQLRFLHLDKFDG